MIAVALKGLAGRKVRALLTAFAVVIGVSMVSGTFILTDTMQKTFDGLFAASYEETDAVIQGKEIVKRSHERLGDGPGVAARPRSGRCPRSRPPAAPSSPAEVNGADIIGQRRQGRRPGEHRRQHRPRQRALQPAQAQDRRLAREGRAGRDRRRHRRQGALHGRRLRAGRDRRRDRVATGSPAPRRYGEVDSLGFGSIAVWDVKTAQSLLDREGQYDSISIAAKDGTSPAELVARRQARSSRTRSRSRTAPSRRREASAELDKGMAYIRYFLLGFGGIALFVGAFVIFNTLSITVAQRTREFATLRTLGASRKQVLRSVRLEGLVDRPARLDDRARSSASGSPRACSPCSARSASTCRRRTRCSPCAR